MKQELPILEFVLVVRNLYLVLFDLKCSFVSSCSAISLQGLSISCSQSSALSLSDFIFSNHSISFVPKTGPVEVIVPVTCIFTTNEDLLQILGFGLVFDKHIKFKTVLHRCLSFFRLVVG